MTPDTRVLPPNPPERTNGARFAPLFAELGFMQSDADQGCPESTENNRAFGIIGSIGESLVERDLWI